ncbi:MAG: hypothetical protein HYV40_01340 [Candidatus Levybacteria bacterium]|nr:hypothetical protein [Candidatus Levybacteria bacterium]
MILSGRKGIIWLFPLILSFLPLIAVSPMTKSVVKVESTDGSSNVRVENDTSSSNTTTTTTTTGRTDIVIECNGVKKEYHSDKAENVTLNCDDSTTGTVKSEVKISNNTSSATTSPNPTIEEAKKKIAEKKEEIKKEVKAAKEKIKERNDLFEEITHMIREFFKNFHF